MCRTSPSQECSVGCVCVCVVYMGMLNRTWELELSPAPVVNVMDHIMFIVKLG